MAASVIAIVVAAGRGTRLESVVPKAYIPLAGKPLIRHTIDYLQATGCVDHVQVVIHPNDIDLYNQSIAGLDLLPPVIGGETRQDSVKAGLEALKPLNPDKVLIHDAARPFVPGKIVQRLLLAIEDQGGAVPVLAVQDSLVRKEVGGLMPIPREGLYRVQTPQAFNYHAILQAHIQADSQHYTDDASLFQAAGHAVVSVEGSVQLAKITTKEDVWMAERSMALAQTRVGFGYDVHRLIVKSELDNKPLLICGVEIPFDYALEGHSDADVGLHAVVDALLGALGEGDIGEHFPPSDMKWKNADSRLFMDYVRNLCQERAACIVNVDVTIICEQPKLSSYKQTMREAMANMLGIECDRVNVKGKTTEKLGFTGRKEGIAAQAVVSVIV